MTQLRANVDPSDQRDIHEIIANESGNVLPTQEWRFTRGDPCVYCGGTRGVQQMTWDHIVPECKGGRLWANVARACSSCNQERGDTPLISWLAHLAHKRAGQRRSLRRRHPVTGLPWVELTSEESIFSRRISARRPRKKKRARLVAMHGVAEALAAARRRDNISVMGRWIATREIVRMRAKYSGRTPHTMPERVREILSQLDIGRVRG